MERAHTITAVLLVIFLGGCAAPTINSTWPALDITADGVDAEWPPVPEGPVDEDQPFSVRISNDDQHLYICLAAAGAPGPRGPAMAGLTLWLDPAGAENRTFGIHLQGARPPRRHHIAAPPPNGAAAPDSSRRESMAGPPPGRAEVQSPQTLSITYQDATGPLEMTLEEVRRTGIDLGVHQGPDGYRVYEFKIAYSAAPCLADMADKSLLGLGIQAGAGKNNRPDNVGRTSAQPPGGGRGGSPGGPPPGGGMDGGPMGRGGPSDGPGRQAGGGGDAIQWMQVVLASRLLEPVQ